MNIQLMNINYLNKITSTLYNLINSNNQTSIIGTNSVNIEVNNNTHLKGSLIANLDENGKDQGNLNIKTASLTYEDIKDIDKSESMGISAGYSQRSETKRTSSS